MSVVIPNTALRHMAATILMHEPLMLRLFQNDHNPDVADTADAYTEADFDGYVAQKMGQWDIESDNPIRATHPNLTFASNSRQNQKVYGYYVTGSSSGDIYWAERFEDPIKIQYRRDRIEIEPWFQHGFGKIKVK